MFKKQLVKVLNNVVKYARKKMIVEEKVINL